jgi:hypothetical protein
MSQVWSEIVARYDSELDAAPAGEEFKLARASIGALAAEIDRTCLGERLFGWTSMHDLCIQQLNRPPYTCAYLRISPLSSGQVDFRYIDTPVAALQWHRIVAAKDTTRRFATFLIASPQNLLTNLRGVPSVTTLPTVSKALGVEMIRDGGSFAASFEDEDGRRYILFTQIKFVDHGELTKERIGYELPILIDCDPAKRPPDTDRKTHGELSGPKIPVTWAEARTLMALTTGLPEGLSEWRLKWLDCMNYIVANDGGVPPSMETMTHWKRPPHMAKVHSDRAAREYVRLGWTLNKELKVEGDDQPYEYFLVWEQDGKPIFPS